MLENVKNAVKEINAAIEDNVTVVLQKGVYDVYPSDTSLRSFKITNSLPQYQCDEFGVTYDKHPAIIIEGRKNVTIDGNGSKLICHGKMLPIYVYGSENITVKNLAVDYADPTVVEMEVLEIGQGYYIFKVHPDSKYRIDENGRITWYGENFEFYDTKHNFGQLYPGTDHIRKLFMGPMKDETARYEDLGDRVLKLTYVNENENPYQLVCGAHLSLRDGIRDECGVLFDNSKDVCLDNCHMIFMHGLGIVSQRCENVTFNKLVCAPEEGSGRKISCFADSSQFSNCRGQIRITDCVFRGTHDDPINVHGTYMKVISSDKNQLLVRFIQPDTTDMNIFRDGDMIEGCDPAYMLKAAEAMVISSEKLNEFDIMLTLDRDASVFQEGYVVENVSACPDVHISGCHSSRVISRGVLCSTRGKVVIENNTFSGFRLVSVLIANDAAWWYESGPVRDVTIRNNRHINCFFSPLYTFKPENTEFVDGEFVHKNITIENNVAEGTEPVAWLWAKSTDNIVMRNNTANFEPLPNELQHCGKVVIE